MERRTVLVVEDEPSARMHATAMFREAGLNVREFESADAAIDYVRDNKHDVAAIFTDLLLPGETDGLELANIVAEVCPSIAVLVTSGRRNRPERLDSRVRYLVKPWRAFEVLAAVRDEVALKAA